MTNSSAETNRFRSANQTASRHPRQLYLLFFTEMWERFSFYGMKALLLAYMVMELRLGEETGYAILGAYAALVYTMPVLGGMLADRLLGGQKAVLFGGILMSLGHLVLALPVAWSFFTGLALIICGNGFFKPNISTMVGGLYADNDPRKDSAFSIFYMGINVGAALGGAVCGWVAHAWSWHAGFGIAGVFMIVGTLIFNFGRKSLGAVGLPPAPAELKEKLGGFLRRDWAVYLLTLLTVPVIIALFHRHELMDKAMPVLGVASILYLLYEAFRLDPEGRRKLLAATVLISFSVVFWAFYEQNAGSLNLFAIRNVDMVVGSVSLPALSVNNFIPPAWVIVLSSVFAWLWLWLSKRGLEPGTSVKFALSFVLVGIGFLTFFMGTGMAVGGKIPLWVLVAGYFFIICGELCISPIGLSMVTKLSPHRMVGLIMGIWFLASALGEFVAAKIGALMAVPEAVVNDPEASLPYYSDILQQIGYYSIGVGVLLLLFTPVLKRWMGAVR
ncbi:peptide MFS transporter [Ravibacter arvi]|uniref:Peptide MFS transporter n=1 Tax=Ravibacter arvi TaxID=2051041 RepID=A0ABP8LWM4_9BACT